MELIPCFGSPNLPATFLLGSFYLVQIVAPLHFWWSKSAPQRPCFINTNEAHEGHNSHTDLVRSEYRHPKCHGNDGRIGNSVGENCLTATTHRKRRQSHHQFTIRHLTPASWWMREEPHLGHPSGQNEGTTTPIQSYHRMEDIYRWNATRGQLWQLRPSRLQMLVNRLLKSGLIKPSIKGDPSTALTW